MLRLDRISTWKLLADGELNSALYTAVESGLNWSLMRFVMSNYEHEDKDFRELVRGFIRDRLFHSEKATRLLLDNLQSKNKDVRRFVLNTRYQPETREFLVRNLVDHRVRRFLLEIWDEENVSWLVLGKLVHRKYEHCDHEEYWDFDYQEYKCCFHEDHLNDLANARNFILSNLNNELVRQSVMRHLHVKEIRDLLLDNLNHKVVEQFMAQCLHVEALQKLLLGCWKGYWYRESRKTTLIQHFLLNNLSFEHVQRFVLDNSEIKPEPYWLRGMTRADGELLIELVVDGHSFCKLLLDINMEPVRALVLSDYCDVEYQSLTKETVQQIVVDNYWCTPVAEFIRKNFSWLEGFLLEHLGEESVLEFMASWVGYREPQVKKFVQDHGLIDRLRRLDWYDRRYLETR
jgi:hypothetical protein